MYDGMKKAFGSSVTKVAPIRSSSGDIITDRGKQLERWVEHYQELYGRENIITTSAVENTNLLPVTDELDATPSMEELCKAIDSLACNKAPGSDGIPPELIKAGAKTVLIHHLHELLLQCWEEGAVPQDMRDATIITLYKNKGDRSDCNNYRGISLLSIVGKAFGRVVLNRLQSLAERVYPEAQCGFRAGRSTIDMIFSLRQLQEKCREQRRPLYIAFIDLTKAFDLVSRKGLFTLLQRIGCPHKLLRIITSFHDDMQGIVQYDGCSSDPFPIRGGVKQGCILAPTLFGIFFSLLLTHAFSKAEEGIYIYTRTDRNLYNIARLQAKTKVRKVLIREMLFADDAALTAHSEVALQQLINYFMDACRDFGLTISLKKTNIMGQDVSSIPNISIADYTLEVVDNFTYLGSTISSNLSLDAELNTRIGKAAAAMARLAKRAWDNSMLTNHTKMRVYQACVLSTLLYGSEAWTLYSRQERRLMFALLSQKRLRWLGHVSRMQDGRIPKDLLYSELATGSRPIGRPVLRYKDVCKRDLKAGNVNPAVWEVEAADRCRWRQVVKASIKVSEKKREHEWEERKKHRRQRVALADIGQIDPGTCYICSNCNFLAAPKSDCTVTAGAANQPQRLLDAYSIVSRDRRMPRRYIVIS
ncbi:probable RNA-directed DNA polymerase from transposon BS isoform X1 [Xyrauchen texanus]|uniref:probable RNA-directed DNA polymerase from transposon BS isoform X1 n=1 Tax=Xyrauchen texanus TaxID=154827 RepID=UPI002242ABFE|nr:probable RNA-directed DNA polymerase from transposon BS isoform X1 [Xyrauchen texanus]